LQSSFLYTHKRCADFLFLSKILIDFVFSNNTLKIIPDDQPVNICPGRVAPSNEQLQSDTHELSVIYQSIVISFTFIFGIVFWYMSFQLFRMTSSGLNFFEIIIFILFIFFSAKGLSKAKQFVFRIGAIIVSSFMLRCILFIVLLTADFISNIYLFITLMITEVLMIFFVQIEFYKSLYEYLQVVEEVTFSSERT